MEAYRSGHNGPHSKCGYRASGTRVRIPSLPPRSGSHCSRKRKGTSKTFVPFSFSLFSFAAFLYSKCMVRNNVALRFVYHLRCNLVKIKVFACFFAVIKVLTNEKNVILSRRNGGNMTSQEANEYANKLLLT